MVHNNKYLRCPSCVVSNALAFHRCHPRSTFLIDRGCIWKGTVVGCVDTLVFYGYSHHTNDSLTLTSLPTRYNDISCRTFFSIFNHFEMHKLFLALLSPRLILSPLNCDVKSLQIKKMVYSKSHCGDTSTPWNNYMLTRIDGIRRGSIHYSLLSSFSFSAFQFFDWHSFIQ